jgi:tetratricopeptide (TPR) repeat protein
VKNRTFFLALSLFGLVAGTSFLGGCKLFKSNFAQDYNEYQAALASGDLKAAQVALIRIVHEKEDIGDYWTELGKIDLQLGEYSSAYDAFSRAYELDRSNVQLLSALTQMALLSGQLPLADEQARTLALLAPENPVVKLVKGYVALGAGNLDQADTEAIDVLSASPTDPLGNILKARVLLARQQVDDATKLLEAQHQAQPQDRTAIRGLSTIYRYRNDWRNLARVQSDLLRLDPKNASVSLTVIEATLRAMDVNSAVQAAAPLLTDNTNAELVDKVLTAWARYAPHNAVLPNAVEIANRSSGAARVSWGNYLNLVAKPEAAIALLREAQLPVTIRNARWNAVLAQSLALQGQLQQARSLFDAVLQHEPDQTDALRGRSALEARTGMTKQAIVDAQRAVSITPKTGEDRILLARAYFAAGNKAAVRRTLWSAFQDIPDDERVIGSLKSVLVSTGDLEGANRLVGEAADEQSKKLKELV